jgi:hypothetical protein
VNVDSPSQSSYPPSPPKDRDSNPQVSITEPHAPPEPPPRPELRAPPKPPLRRAVPQEAGPVAAERPSCPASENIRHVKCR